MRVFRDLHDLAADVDEKIARRTLIDDRVDVVGSSETERIPSLYTDVHSAESRRFPCAHADVFVTRVTT